MASKDVNSRKQGNKTDDAIQDYLSDIWGSPAEKDLTEVAVPDIAISDIEEPTIQAENIFEKPIVPALNKPLLARYSLIPTIKLSAGSADQILRSQTDSLLILLTGLYFLRRPLSPKVRKFILILSEQAIDDFHAAFWLQLPSLVGVNHEV